MSSVWHWPATGSLVTTAETLDACGRFRWPEVIIIYSSILIKHVNDKGVLAASQVRFLQIAARQGFQIANAVQNLLVAARFSHDNLPQPPTAHLGRNGRFIGTALLVELCITTSYVILHFPERR